MSDYTPTLRERIREQLPQTTAEFRARLSIYAVETTKGQVSGFKRSEELAELFDLWLAEVKAQERERIVKLIEPEYNRGDPMWEFLDRLLVALIKGEEQ